MIPLAVIAKRRRNVLGMNARILSILRPLNPHGAVQTANDKLATKQALSRAGIPVPRTYGVIHSRRDAERFAWSSLPGSFVLKPNLGFGGSGILVVFGRNKRGEWIGPNRQPVDVADVRERTYNILDGNYSIGNVPDTAIFEQRVRVARDLKPYASGGIPDIRIVTANFIPVMAMLRLPTPGSVGRSNLHAGGIGVGVDLSTGTTTTAVSRDRAITVYPGTRLRLSGMTLPAFRDTLLLAVRAARALRLGYAGVDIAVDREEGPLVLEVNARPGLSIQLANGATLRDRIRRLEELQVADPQRAVDIALSLFARPTATSPKRRTIGVREDVTIFDTQGIPHQHVARIDTGAYRSSIDRDLAETYGLWKHAHTRVRRKTKSALGREERPVIPLTFILSGERIVTEVTVAERGHLKHELLIGRRDLGRFLIDPTIKSAASPSAG
jgi:alpha-L-glutamate ligase-like protein